MPNDDTTQTAYDGDETFRRELSAALASPRVAGTRARHGRQEDASPVGPAILTELRGYGFSWRDVARIVGVSVPALQKWRRGEGISTGNLLRLAELVALTRTLKEEHLLPDPVSWLDTPVRTGVHLSKTDLLAARRFDMVLEIAADDQDGSTPDSHLDAFDADWREKYVDDAFEVFIAKDGLPSIRARQ